MTRTRPSGSATSVCRPLSSTTASYLGGRAAREAELLGLDLLALDAEHPGQLAGVRGEHGGDAERAGRRGVSASASTTTGTPSASASASACSASAPPPEPTTQACTRPVADHDLGVLRADQVGGAAPT